MPTNIRTPADISAEQRQQVEQAKVAEARSRASEIAATTVADQQLENLPDKDVETLTYLYPEWSPNGVAYVAQQRIRYEGILYRVVQDHTSQADWQPPNVPALFTRFRNPQAGPQPWVQPTGAQDAYSTGERVTHDNPNDGGTVWVYESSIDANTTEPGRDSTFDRYWTPVEPV